MIKEIKQIMKGCAVIGLLALTFISCAQPTTPEPTPTSEVTFSKKGAVDYNCEVTLSSETKDATIYYTEDGSNPSVNSTKYTSPILIDKAKTIKAFAVKEGCTDSKVTSADYTIKTYTVKFVTEFGKAPEPISDLKKGDKITKPTDPTSDPKKEVEGWFIEDKQWNFETDFITEDITLTAKWGVKKFTVKFDATEYCKPIAVIKAEIDSKITKPTKDYSGFKESNWYNGDKVWNFDTDTVTSDITLKLKGTPYTINDPALVEYIKTMTEGSDLHFEILASNWTGATSEFTEFYSLNFINAPAHNLYLYGKENEKDKTITNTHTIFKHVQELYLMDNITDIGNNTFAMGEFTKLYMKEVKKLAVDDFRDNEKLEEVYIPESLTFIHARSFSRQSNKPIKNIHINTSVEHTWIAPVFQNDALTESMKTTDPGFLDWFAKKLCDPNRNDPLLRRDPKK